MATKKDDKPRFVITANEIDRLAPTIGFTLAEVARLKFSKMWPRGYDTVIWGWRSFFESFSSIAGVFYVETPQDQGRRLRLYADYFDEYNFHQADMRFSHMSDCIFRDCDLSWANATDAVFIRCAFPGADLRNANLTRATFIDCTDLDLTGAITNGAYINGEKQK